MVVKIEFYQNSSGLFQGFEVSGHAGYAGHGEDIVCAGISAVTQTAVLGLASYLNEADLETKKNSGFLCCSIKNIEALRKTEVQAVLRTAFLGLEAMAESYGGYLQLVNIITD